MGPAHEWLQRGLQWWEQTLLGAVEDHGPRAWLGTGSIETSTDKSANDARAEIYFLAVVMWLN